MINERPGVAEAYPGAVPSEVSPSRLRMPRWSRARWVLVILGALVVVLLLGARTSERVPDGPIFADQLVDAIGVERGDAGVAPLTRDACLDAASNAALETYLGELNMSPAADTSACDGEAFEMITRSVMEPELLVDRWSQLGRYGEGMRNPDATTIGAACVRVGSDFHPQAVCSVLVATP